MKLNFNYPHFENASNQISHLARQLTRDTRWDKLDIAAELLSTQNTAQDILRVVKEGNLFDRQGTLMNTCKFQRKLKLLSCDLHTIAHTVEKTLNSEEGKKWGSYVDSQGNFVPLSQAFQTESIPLSSNLKDIKNALQSIQEEFNQLKKGELIGKRNVTWNKGIVHLDRRIDLLEEVKKLHETAEELDKNVSQLNLQHIKTAINRVIDQPDHHYTITEIQEMTDMLRCYFLESQQTTQDKEWIQTILKFKNHQKRLFVIDPLAIPDDNERKQYKKALKNLQTAALSIFKETISQQQGYLLLLKRYFAYLKEQNILQEVEFIEEQLKRWEKKLIHNKPVAFPKWYHCTQVAIQTLFNMAISEIRVSAATVGAYVANRPTHVYGSYGIAMSDSIESQATNHHTVMPIRTWNQGFHIFDTKGYREDQGDWENKQISTVQWIGFQLPISFKRPDKQEDPLGYYEKKSIAYLFYEENARHRIPEEEKAKGRELAKQHKLQFIRSAQAQQMVLLMRFASVLVLPKEWKDGL